MKLETKFDGDSYQKSTLMKYIKWKYVMDKIKNDAMRFFADKLSILGWLGEWY